MNPLGPWREADEGPTVTPRMASRTKAHGSVDAYVADLPPARARVVNRVRRSAALQKALVRYANEKDNLR